MFFTHADFCSKLLIKGFDDNRFNVIQYASVGMRHYHKERSEVKSNGFYAMRLLLSDVWFDIKCMFCVLCVMCYVLRVMFCVLCVMFCVLQSTCYVLCFKCYVLRFIFAFCVYVYINGWGFLLSISLWRLFCKVCVPCLCWWMWTWRRLCNRYREVGVTNTESH